MSTVIIFTGTCIILLYAAHAVKVQSLKVVTGCKPTCMYQTGEQGYGMPHENQYAYKPGALLNGATWLIQMVGNAVYRQVDESMVLTASWPTPLAGQPKQRGEGVALYSLGNMEGRGKGIDCLELEISHSIIGHIGKKLRLKQNCM